MFRYYGYLYGYCVTKPCALFIRLNYLCRRRARRFDRVAGNVLHNHKMAVDTSNGKLNTGTSKGRIVERRKRERFRAQWRVRLWSASGEIVEALTANVSSGGFYCYSSKQFSEGDRVRALLEMKGGSAEGEAPKLVLRCDIEVLRVEALIDGCQWGFACQILDYSVAGPTGSDELGSMQEKS